MAVTDDTDLTDFLVRIARAREALAAPLRELLKAYFLTEQQWRVLRTLKAEGRADVAALAARTAILVPSMSRIVKELRSRGYLTKSHNPGDHRRVYACLTRQGSEILDSIAPGYETICFAVGSSIGKRTLAQALNALSDIESNAPKPAAIQVSADAVPGNVRGRPRQ
jgi:homoprotocatechuate degradation regulator HpaR